MTQDFVLNLIKSMASIIEEQDLVVTCLLDLAFPKREAIVADDLVSLKKISHAEEGHLARLAELETARVQLAAELASATGVATDEVKASYIQNLARDNDPQLAARLQTDLERFAHHYKKLMAENQQNTLLLQDTLSYIDNVIHAITGSNEGVTYSSRGEMGEAPVRRYINTRV